VANLYYYLQGSGKTRNIVSVPLRGKYRGKLKDGITLIRNPFSFRPLAG